MSVFSWVSGCEILGKVLRYVTICLVSCVGWIEEVASLKAISTTCGESLNTPSHTGLVSEGRNQRPEVKVTKRIMDPKKFMGIYTSMLSIFVVFVFVYVNSQHHLPAQTSGSTSNCKCSLSFTKPRHPCVSFTGGPSQQYNSA